MSKSRNTPYASESESASRYHYILGRCCYYTDLDFVPMQKGSCAMNCEFTFDNDQVKPVAMIDYKHTGQSLSTHWPAIQCQIKVAAACSIPFFFVIYFLDEEYETKCYYVIPVNQIAKDKFNTWKFDLKGRWFSLQGFSRFQHALRNKKWDGNEIIPDKNLELVGLPTGTRLKDLPNKINTSYPLPKIEVP